MKHALLLAFTTLLALNAHAAPQKLEAKGGQVEFLAIGKPAFIKIQGKGAPPTGEVQVNDGQAQAKLDFDVSSLDTGIELRNKHMKEKYLQTPQYPHATLTIPNMKLASGYRAPASLPESDFDGELELHGVKKPVHGKFQLDKEGQVNAQFKVKLSDFKIDVPTYMGITVADEVEVKVNIHELKNTL